MKSTPLYPSPRGVLELGYEQFEREAILDTRAREAYSSYLESLSWDYYATVTFRKPWRDTIKAHEAVWGVLHSECHAKRAFVAVEKHRFPSKEVHVHALISDYDGSWRPNVLLPWDMWSKLFHHFGRTQVEAINSTADVAAYCSKYVVKSLSDYAFYGAPNFWDK